MYLTPDVKIAKVYGKVLLEVSYEPKGVELGVDNYGFDLPESMTCWQFSVFCPIKIENVRRIDI